ncbi:MAG TPA: DUF1572 family protein [Candidatus Sulfotelmatobacter sp.]|jgi:hypothetical protein|nr:DUF1572 family protein [Candidatus Sulfotelmatobacter sp.]
MADQNSFAMTYFDEVRRSFRGYKRLAEGALAQIEDRDFFRLPDPESNSAALIVKHVAGNLRSRWKDFLTTDGEKPDRNRDQEFLLMPEDTRQDLARRWEESFQIVFDVIESLTPEDFSRTVTIRGEPHTILQAMNRSLTHTSYHVGQILYVGKYLRGAAWTMLSIPKGKSAEFNAIKPDDRKAKAPNRP